MTEVNFSAREMEVLALAWQCMLTEPKIDMVKLANLAGYTEGSARYAFAGIKRKLKQHAEGKGATDKAGTSGSAASTPKKQKTADTSTPKKGTPKAGSAKPRIPGKKAVEPKPEPESEEECMPTPSKKRKTAATPRRSAPVKAATYDGDSDDDCKTLGEIAVKIEPALNSDLYGYGSEYDA